MIAAMMASVSPRRPTSPRCTGLPTRTRTGRRVQQVGDVGDPRRARPHGLGPPHPDGEDRCAGHGGQPGRAGLALQHRIEELLAARDRPLGQDHDDLARLEGTARRRATARRSGCPGPPGSRPGPAPVGRRPVRRTTRAWPGTARAAQPGRHHGQGHDVEVAAVVGGQDDRSAPGHAGDAVDVEARVGEQAGPHERSKHVVGLEPAHLGHPGGPVPVLDGPAPQAGHGVAAADRGSPRGDGPPPRARAGRRRCRSRRGWRPGRPRWPGPTPTAAACPWTTRSPRRCHRCSARRPVPRGEHVVEPEPRRRG